MPITTSPSPPRYLQDLELILHEWLTDTDCFGSGASALADVFPYTIQDTARADMKRPWCEYQLHVRGGMSTGAGALGREGRFWLITIEISLRAKRPEDALDLVILGDQLQHYFRMVADDEDPTILKGRAALGQAGLRHANLVGPIREDSSRYHLHRWLLEGRFLAQGTE